MGRGSVAGGAAGGVDLCSGFKDVLPDAEGWLEVVEGRLGLRGAGSCRRGCERDRRLASSGLGRRFGGVGEGDFAMKVEPGGCGEGSTEQEAKQERAEAAAGASCGWAAGVAGGGSGCDGLGLLRWRIQGQVRVQQDRYGCSNTGRCFAAQGPSKSETIRMGRLSEGTEKAEPCVDIGRSESVDLDFR